jgi:hypothetical protein
LYSRKVQQFRQRWLWIILLFIALFFVVLFGYELKKTYTEDHLPAFSAADYSLRVATGNQG